MILGFLNPLKIEEDKFYVACCCVPTGIFQP